MRRENAEKLAEKALTEAKKKQEEAQKAAAEAAAKEAKETGTSPATTPAAVTPTGIREGRQTFFALLIFLFYRILQKKNVFYYTAPPARPIPGLNLTQTKPASSAVSPSTTPASTPATTPAEEKPKSGGFISRLFGSKSKDKIAEEVVGKSNTLLKCNI